MKNYISKQHIVTVIVVITVFSVIVGGAALWRFYVRSQEEQVSRARCTAEAQRLVSQSTESDEGEISEDAWGKPYRYSVQVSEDQKDSEVKSAGRDGVFDTKDDVLSKAHYEKPKSVSKRIKGFFTRMWE